MTRTPAENDRLAESLRGDTEPLIPAAKPYRRVHRSTVMRDSAAAVRKRVLRLLEEGRVSVRSNGAP